LTALLLPAKSLQDNLIFPKEAQRMIDKKLDSLFQPWWRWYATWEPTIQDKSLDAKGVMRIYEEMTQPNRFPGHLDNYSAMNKDLQKAVVSSVIKKYPKCEDMEWQVMDYYEKTYYMEKSFEINKTISSTLDQKSQRPIYEDF